MRPPKPCAPRPAAWIRQPRAPCRRSRLSLGRACGPARTICRCSRRRKIVELRMATPRPGDAGSRTIAELCENEDPDRLLLVVVGEKLDSSAARAAWAKSIEEHGVVVEIWPIERGELAALGRGARARGGLEAHAGGRAASRRARRRQPARGGSRDQAARDRRGRPRDRRGARCSSRSRTTARFDVFRLTDAVLAGDAERAIKVLWGLKGEGVAPVLVSWALSREIVLLARLQYAAAHGENLDAALQRLGRLAAPPAACETGNRALPASRFPGPRVPVGRG